MHAPTYALAITAWLLLGVADAVSAENIVARSAANPTAAWVTVNKNGVPKTVTPVVSTVSGTTTIISGAPNALTGTVFTTTTMAEVLTSTGDPPLPTATATNGAGAFSICDNTDGTDAPFCDPTAAASLYTGTTYYVTWDSSFFNDTNTTVVVSGSYYNTTTKEVSDKVFTSSHIKASLSFYAWTVNSTILTEKSVSAANVSLKLTTVENGTASGSSYQGPTVLVTKRPAYVHRASKTTGPALYIGLPMILVFVVMVVLGTYLWNRKTRRIGLGNIMGRGRDGYAVGKSRGQRIRLPGRLRRGRDKDQAIRLMEQDVVGAGEARGGRYRDHDGHDGAAPGVRGDDDGFELDLPRRDSDALGSLAGTPTEDRRMDLGRPGKGGNAFRDELSRQQRERQEGI